MIDIEIGVCSTDYGAISDETDELVDIMAAEIAMEIDRDIIKGLMESLNAFAI